MGGSPRGKDKPRPSYEDGKLRDKTIAAQQDAAYRAADLERLIKKAAKPLGSANGVKG